MGNERSEESDALLELLADGEWHHGQRVLHEIQRVITPGVASRAAAKELKDPDKFSMEERIRMGRRALARKAISRLVYTGRLEADVEITRAHWAGEFPWQVRDTEAGWLAVSEMADELDLPTHVVRNWVDNGYVPVSKNRVDQLRFTPEQAEIVRKVAPHYPGANKRWSIDPRTLWDRKEAAVTVVCPNCECKLEVNLTVQS